MHICNIYIYYKTVHTYRSCCNCMNNYVISNKTNSYIYTNSYYVAFAFAVFRNFYNHQA